MGARGRPTKAECVHGHDLTDNDNVAVVKRGKYKERQCVPCRRRRSRKWWRENRGRAA